MENLKGMWNFAYDWNSTGQFYIVRLVIKNNGRFQFPDFGRVGGRWAKLDGNIIMKINNNVQTSYKLRQRALRLTPYQTCIPVLTDILMRDITIHSQVTPER